MVALKKIDYDLSLKLGDPVTENGDGDIFDFVDRLRYLERGYARIMRILPKLMGTKTPLFSQSKEYLEMSIATANKTGKAIPIKSSDTEIIVEDVEELYISVTQIAAQTADASTVSDVTTIKGTFIQPDKYLSVKNGESTDYTPSISKKKVFYTFFANKLYLLPESPATYHYSKIYVTFKKDAPSFTIDSTIPITNEYIDLLITFAANEGMQDIARGDKVNIYTGDLSGQLAILKGYADKSEAKEGSDING